VAIKAMTPPDLDSVGIVGCGAQGLSQAVFAAAVRPVKLVHCFDRSAERAERCCTALRARLTGVTITRSPSPEHLLERSSAVVTATTSETPVLPGAPAALEGKHFFGIGSFRPSMQELPDAVFSLAGALVIDSDHAAAETGDIIQPLQKNLIPPDRVFTLADVILGRRHIDTSATTVFKSTGMALFDLFVAAALARAAEAKKIGQEVTL
jgi:ornithine cyclodeaminase